MRSFLLFLALTLVVATASAEDSVSEKFVDRGKAFYAASKKFFTEDPVGQRILKFLIDVNEMVIEGG
ncbi:unnamed protein product [Hymenolepis diminuta]|uniref:Uncharacterized protein n=1 Tax=Hymenolepis diminuta TaxID=6216 RepID=A0A564YA79_HYMDI|nr:unnamed protein product [Hymenolepis diminuta]